MLEQPVMIWISADDYLGTARAGDTTSANLNQLQQRANQQASRPDLSSEPAEPIAAEHNLRQESNNIDTNPFTTWDEMGLSQEEFGFLGRFDLPDIASWFIEIPP